MESFNRNFVEDNPICLSVIFQHSLRYANVCQRINRLPHLIHLLSILLQKFPDELSKSAIILRIGVLIGNKYEKSFSRTLT